jgi:EF hand domain-containing protein
MRRRLGLFTIVLGLAGLGAPPGTAQSVGNAHLVGGFTQLFISPCGEPYRGRPGEPYPVVLWFKQADLNHDGVVDHAEFLADHAGFFDALDSDGNGYLDATELAFYEHRVVPDVFGHDAKLGLVTPRSGEALAERDGVRLILVQGTGQPHAEQAPPGPEGAQGPLGGLNAHRKAPRIWEGAAAYGLLAEPEPVAAADTDLDGRITKAEFQAAAERRFKLLDKRKDGKLTLDELPMTGSQAVAAGIKVQ